MEKEQEMSFGAWLKQQRRTLDLTQVELAAYVGCAVETIKRIEQDVRRPGKQIVIRLLDCLAIPPTDRAAISRFARTGQRDPLPRASGLVSTTISSQRDRESQIPRPPTRLIGRDAEQAHIQSQFQRPEVRLMTLLGPPGVGKTHLALQVAADLLPLFADGVAFIDLAPISDPSLVPATIMRVLGLQEGNRQPPMQQLLVTLRNQQRLLVLDNFEQVVAAAPLVSTLLAHCPQLAILVTSRIALHLRSEWQIPVAPLVFPDIKHLPPLSVVADTPAVALFVERVQQRKPDFRLTRENGATVVALCGQLDGLPLAIELAAAWVPHFSLAALLDLVSSPRALLADMALDRPPRHQTLDRAIAWSYDTLGSGTQHLFARLSVFIGGCTSEAAATVCHEQGDAGVDTRDRLFALADRHLMQQAPGPDGQPRFSMLVTIREYAEAILMAENSANRFRQRHANYYLTLAETLEPELKGPRQVAHLDRLQTEQANLSAALKWSLEHDTDMALRLAGALWRFWLMRGYFDEGHHWLERALACTPGQATVPRAKALNGAGVLAHAQGDADLAQTLLTEALQVYRVLHERAGMLPSLNNLAIVAQTQGQFQQAYDYSMEGLSIARELNDRTSIVYSLNTLGTNAEALGDYRGAERWFEESLRVATEVGEIQAINIIQNNLSTLAFAQGEYQKAIRINKSILNQVREHRFNHLLAHMLLILGDAHLFQGKYPWAKRYLAENLRLAKEIGAVHKVIETLISLGYLALEEQDYRHMHALYAESLALAQTLDNPLNIVACLEGLAAAAALQRQRERSIRLFAAAARQRQQVGVPKRASDYTRYQRYTALLTAVQQQLNQATFADIWSEGYNMTLEQAIVVALEAG